MARTASHINVPTRRRSSVVNESLEQRHCRKWSQQEDAVLARYVRAYPHRLHYCFLCVAEEIHRTPTAVQAHWYAVLSKKAETFFFTASPRHISKNRKNGAGEESNNTVWRRLMAAIRSIIG